MKPFIKLFVIFIFGLIIVLSCFGQSGDVPKKDHFIVTGTDFKFSVKTPEGWIGENKNSTKYFAHIIYFRTPLDTINGNALIRIYCSEKVTNDVREDLTYTSNNYKAEIPELKEKDFEVYHIEYKCYSKMFYLENNLYDYMVFIDPGKEFKHKISIDMMLTKPATIDELFAFREIAVSIKMLKG
jgi:hypothetical protein